MNDREYGKRPERADSNDRRRPARPEGPGGRAERDDRAERPAWQTRVDRGTPSRDKSPMIPEEITPKDLELGVRVQLKTLTAENADMVARHLAMVVLLINDDPELAHKHALAASQRAGRIAVVRETVGITAYRVGDFALALRELLTHRRISGSNEQIPLIVDCERGLGRPDRALEAGRAVDRSTLPAEARVNLAIAMSGARLDRNENDLALAELQIPELNIERVFDYSPALFRAYAETLRAVGKESEGQRWDTYAERSEQALAGRQGPEDELFEVIEEFEIPAAYESRNPRDAERAPRTDRRESGERRDFAPREPSRREWKPRESERPNRETPRNDRPTPRRDSPAGDQPKGDRPSWKGRNER